MLYFDVTVGGIVTGGIVALLAVGLTLLYGTTRILNFAHASFAMVAAFVFADVANQGLPVPIAALTAIAASVALAAAVERLVIRRVAERSPTSRLVTTLGLMALFGGLAMQIFGFRPRQAPSFVRGGLWIGDLRIAYDQVLVVAVAVGVATFLTFFLRHTRLGVALRATADDPLAAELVGVRPSTMLTINWLVAAGLAALAGVLIAPLTFITVATFPGLLVPAFAAMLVGGMTRVNATVVGAIALSVAAALATARSGITGIGSVAIVVVLTVLMMLRPQPDVEHLPDVGLPAGSRAAPVARVVFAIACALAVGYSLTVDFWAFTGVRALVVILVGAGLVLVTGWMGSFSLMPATFVGIGAFGVASLAGRLGWPLGAAVVGSVGLGFVAGALVGLVASRLRGLQVGMFTLAVSVAASAWLFNLRFIDRTFERPDWLVSDRRLFLASLPIVALVLALLSRFRRSSRGKVLIAVRDAGDAVEHFGIRTLRLQMVVFGLSGALGALGGCLYGVAVTSFKPEDFGVQLTISYLVFFLVGGRESLWGPVLAGLLFVYGPELVQTTQTTASALPDIVAGLVVLGLVLVRPEGIAGLLDPPTRSVAPAAGVEPGSRETVVRDRSERLSRGSVLHGVKSGERLRLRRSAWEGSRLCRHESSGSEVGGLEGRGSAGGHPSSSARLRR